MKAVVYHRYGSADVLKLEEIEKPTPKDEEVLIKVRAAALNPLDWRMLKGVPFIIRKTMKVGKPTAEHGVGIGRDVAGVIEAVGRKVSQFRVGDEVFGAAASSVAEYACTKVSAVAIKPEHMSFAQAASVPVAGYTALQGLRKGKIQSGQKVLVNGAAGGVGTFAVQIAKAQGAEVTGVCSAANLEMVLSIGADKVIDYTQEDFTKSEEKYDIILECVGNKSYADCRPVLAPNGRFVMIGAPHEGSLIMLMASALGAVISSLFTRQKALMFMAKSNPKDLVFMGELFDDGKLTPVIDRTCTLTETPEAIRYLEAGHARGKVVITLN